jgi:hypothetical protein
VRSTEAAVRHDGRSRAYYEKKRAEGKKHKAAILVLARRRMDVIHALLKDGSLFEPQATG